MVTIHVFASRRLSNERSSIFPNKSIHQVHSLLTVELMISRMPNPQQLRERRSAFPSQASRSQSQDAALIDQISNYATQISGKIAWLT